MHLSKDFREKVEEKVPGSTDVLTKITGVDYKKLDNSKTGSYEDRTIGGGTNGIAKNAADSKKSAIYETQNGSTSRQFSSETGAQRVTKSANDSLAGKNELRGDVSKSDARASGYEIRTQDGGVPLSDDEKATILPTIDAAERSLKRASDSIHDSSTEAHEHAKDLSSIDPAEKILKNVSDSLHQASTPSYEYRGESKERKAGRAANQKVFSKESKLAASSKAAGLEEAGSSDRSSMTSVPTSTSISSRASLPTSNQAPTPASRQASIPSSTQSSPSTLTSTDKSLKQRSSDSVESSDITRLKAQIASLRSELESQTKWEVFRIQEAINAQSVMEKRNAGKAAAEAQKKFAQEKSSATEKARREAEQSFSEKLAKVKREADQRFQKRVDQAVGERENTLRLSVRSELASKAKSETDARVQELQKMRGVLSTLEKEFDAGIEQRKAARESSQIAAATFAMRDNVDEDAAFGKIVSELRKTKTGKAIVEALPSEAAPTPTELKAGFKVVGKEGRRAALLSEGVGGSVWAHMLATVASKIKIGIDNFGFSRLSDEPQSNEDRIRRAERLIEENNLSDGVKLLNEVDGFAKEIIADWLTDAKHRLAANQAAKILQTDAVLSQVVLSSANVKSGKEQCCH